MDKSDLAQIQICSIDTTQHIGYATVSFEQYILLLRTCDKINRFIQDYFFGWCINHEYTIFGDFILDIINNQFKIDKKYVIHYTIQTKFETYLCEYKYNLLQFIHSTYNGFIISIDAEMKKLNPLYICTCTNNDFIIHIKSKKESYAEELSIDLPIKLLRQLSIDLPIESSKESLIKLSFILLNKNN